MLFNGSGCLRSGNARFGLCFGFVGLAIATGATPESCHFANTDDRRSGPQVGTLQLERLMRATFGETGADRQNELARLFWGTIDPDVRYKVKSPKKTPIVGICAAAHFAYRHLIGEGRAIAFCQPKQLPNVKLKICSTN